VTLEIELRNQVHQSLQSLEVEGQSAVARYRFAADLSVFEGHFPGYALVPGVYLIEAVTHAFGRVVGKPLCISEVKRARFTGEVRPGQDVIVQIVWEEGDPAACRATVTSEAGECASIRVRFGA